MPHFATRLDHSLPQGSGSKSYLLDRGLSNSKRTPSVTAPNDPAPSCLDFNVTVPSCVEGREVLPTSGPNAKILSPFFFLVRRNHAFPVMPGLRLLRYFSNSSDASNSSDRTGSEAVSLFTDSDSCTMSETGAAWVKGKETEMRNCSANIHEMMQLLGDPLENILRRNFKPLPWSSSGAKQIRNEMRSIYKKPRHGLLGDCLLGRR